MRIIYLIFSLFLIGCEKTININLIGAKTRPVIEGIITDNAGPYFVKVSHQLDTSVYTSFDSASVVIWDDHGQRDTLINSKPGVFKTTTLIGVPGRKYFIIVKIGASTYSASNTIPLKSNLDSLIIDTLSYNNINYFTVTPCFIDRLEHGNYYRFIQSINDTTDKTIFLFSDKTNNGINSYLPLISINSNVLIKKTDLVKVEMQCIDKSEFDYFSTISMQTNFNIGGNPAYTNPISNFNGDALGFFSTHTSQLKSIVVLRK